MRTRTALGVALCLIAVEQLLGTVVDSPNRTLVEMPAWKHLWAQAWAAFSRSADLGNGTILYPLAGIGGLVLILAAAIVLRLGPRRPWSVAIYGAALLTICVILTTTQAALLQGSGKFMRHVKLRPGTATNAAALSRLIDAGYLDIKDRVENG